MAENMVKMQAFAGLSDPYAGGVQAGEEFETSVKLSARYVKQNVAGPAGVSAREVQLGVSGQEFEARQHVQAQAREARAGQRNLGTDVMASGNAAAVDVLGKSMLGSDTRAGAATAATTSNSATAKTDEGTDYEGKANAELKAEAESRELDVPASANKAELVSALEEDDQK